MITPDLVIGPVSGDGIARLLATMSRKPAVPDLWTRVGVRPRIAARR